MSGSGTTWTYTYTPPAGNGTDTFAFSVGTDAYGNVVTATPTSGATVTVDNTAPTASSFTMSDTSLIVGETATVTLVFSEVVESFSSSADMTVQNGSLSTMSSSDNITWTGTFTPTDDLEDATNVLTLATSYTDTAGNKGTAATTANYAIDTKEPTVSSFTMSDTSLIVGETSTVTLVFSEAVASFSNADITVVNGSLSTMSSSDNITWTGTFTPTDDLEDATNVLTLATSYIDTAGNSPESTATTANYAIDTKEPTVSSFTMSDTSLIVGETATVTLVFSEAVASFSSSADITVQNGSLSAMSSSDNITWTGTFTPTDDIEDATNVLTLATSYMDTAGNTGTAATTANYAIDTKEPTVSSFTMSDTALVTGETSTVTLVFSEAVASFSSTADIIVQNGSLSAMSSSDNITWTGTFTPTDDLEDATNVLTLATSYTDTAGNSPESTATTANYAIDTKEPTVSLFTMSDTSLIVGETSTVTLVFSEAVASFSNADITVVNGSLSTMSSGDNITWTGTFTPTDDLEDATNVLTLATSYTDTAGNTGTAATTANYAIDTKEPTVSSFTMSDTALITGETSTVTLVFSEAVASFSSSADIIVQNGSLSAMSSSDNITWTGTFTPTANTEGATNVLTLATSYTDTAGNSPESTATTANYSVETLATTVSLFTMSDTSLIVGETSTVTLVFSEAVASFSSSDDIIVQNGSLSAMSSSDNIIWTGTFTPTDDLEDATNVLTLTTSYTDTAGNTGTISTTANYAIDTKEPTVSSFTMSDTSLIVGETSTVTLVFSEAVASFSNADITVQNGSLSTMSSSDNITWTGTFTPTDDLEDATNVLTLATSYTDTAGNSPESTATTANYAIDTTSPLISLITVNAFSWGDVLNSTEDNSDGTVSVTTSGVEDGQIVTITLNGATYTNTVTSNATTVTISATGLQALTDGATYTMVADVSDAAGNAAATRTSSSFIVDVTAPVITITGDNPATVELGATYTDAGATADGGETVTSSGTVDTSTVGTYTITYSATDAAGNAATQVTRTVNVVDTTAPVITITGDNPVTVELGATYTDAGATATDLSGAITVTSTSTVDTSVVGSYTVTYSASDVSGNAATQVTRTVNVVDTTAPVITITGDNPVTVELGATYTDAGATATDLSGAITVTSTSTVDTSVVGSYTVTYSASDVSGNAATQVTRTVNVVDTTAPVITITGDNPVTVELGATYTDAGATATDLSGAITVTSTSTVDTSVVGSYTVTYSASDVSGNAATQVTRTVNVVDTTAPVITITGDNPVTVELGATYTDAGATATDLSGAITVTSTSTVDTSVVGSYTVTYSASDASGNAATQVTRTVNVVDTTAPVLTEVTPIETPSSNRTPSYVFTTSEAGTISSNLTFSSTTDATTGSDQVITFTQLRPGTYSGVTVSVTDASGNVGTITIPEFVIDLTASSNEIPDFRSLALYPNPAVDKVYLSNPRHIDLEEVIIYDLTGRTVHRVDLSSTGIETIIDVSHLSNATYMLVIRSSQGATTKKIIINN